MTKRKELEKNQETTPDMRVDTSLEDAQQVIRSQAMRLAQAELANQALSRNLIAARVAIAALEADKSKPPKPEESEGKP